MDIIFDRKEIARYLGYKREIPDDRTKTMIEDCIAEALKIGNNRFTYQCFDMEIMNEKEIAVKNTNCIFRGSHITKHLSNCEKIIMMGCTIGIETDRKIKLLENTDITKAVIFNAVATTYIEALCDEVQGQIRKKYFGEGYCITNRYSPGYGDFNILQQRDIAALLKANTKIGLTVTENGLSIPFKSVTAIIGLYKNHDNKNEENGCKNCNLSCEFRK